MEDEREPFESWAPSTRTALLVLAILVPALVGLDYWIGAILSMRLPYFALTGFAAWTLGRKGGIAVAITAAAFDAMLHAPALRVATALELAWDGVSQFAVLLGFALVVASYRRSVVRARAQSRVDPETGLASRREFERHLEAEVKRAERYRRPLALVLIECAGLKGGAGAAALGAVGRTAQAHLREGDGVGRIGDHRLGLILLECRVETANQVVGRIRERLEEAMHQKLRTGSLVLGAVSYGGQSKSSAGELLHLADAQLKYARTDRGVQAAETSVP
jgi:diguanylate cyclase (GGDEF)-like protein